MMKEAIENIIDKLDHERAALKLLIAELEKQRDELALRQKKLGNAISGLADTLELLADTSAEPTKLIVMRAEDIPAAKALMGAKPKQERRSKIERAVVSALQAAANAPMTNHQLATAAGVSAPSVSRCLSRMVERGLLLRRGGRYVLAMEPA
jgi:CRP-like cAMP-binding protein